MQRQFRKTVSDQCEYTDILHDHPVQPGFIERLQIGDQLCEFVLFQKGVHRKVDLPSHKMCHMDGPADILCREIVRVGPGAEFLAA